MTRTSNSRERTCLVTVGATVGFPALTNVVLEPAFWSVLQKRGFTSLRLQCGPDIESASQKVSLHSADLPKGFRVDVFERRKNLMKEEMVLCKEAPGQKQGLIISHAGTGSILDAWKVGVPLIVVPNAALLDNHQAEMAAHVAKEGYATASKPELNALQGAIEKVEILAQRSQSRWPANSVNVAGSASSLWSLAPDEVTKEQNAQMAHD
ncbi:hypothetical protein NLU13_7544 [Sarocladium strictum]|uniref:UDP-N-acetylglucosamine transferase subunit ALG13 n=1 Tax=Sarocladium strictum TaxID=5046 RepID=A0AA39L5A7_SARSR|nr:hypothetical protein NLU13_7544 [Sarocladium strictum]